ncbi:hypothetical protein [Microbacterium testaceum]|uniref:hypothetical protein n=1 Tax=Microbacterium testaceum TaxID=2033 RepID=UPI0012ACED8B|nr:hypothetical protein [Microbacterium testaceum]
MTELKTSRNTPSAPHWTPSTRDNLAPTAEEEQAPSSLLAGLRPSLMRRFRTLPLWALAPVYFVFFAGAYFAGGQLALPDGPLAARLIGTSIFATVMTVVFTVIVVRQRSDAGGALELDRIGHALKTGRVPAEIDVVAWATIVERQHQLLRRALWLNPVVFGLMTPVALSLTITRSPYWGLAAAFFVVMLVVSVVTTPRSLRKNAIIREVLARRSEIDATQDGQPAADPSPGPPVAG